MSMYPPWWWKLKVGDSSWDEPQMLRDLNGWDWISLYSLFKINKQHYKGTYLICHSDVMNLNKADQVKGISQQYEMKMMKIN